jgi:hypothetical protein
MKRTGPLAVTFICGVFMIASFFFNEKTAAAEIAGKLQEWAIILGAFAAVLGITSVVQVSWHKMRRREDTVHKAALLVCLFVTALLGFLFGTEADIRPNWLIGKWHAGGSNPFFWIYYNVQLPLNATMFSLLVFFITSAAYRAFRIRSVEAGILLATGVIVMLGQVPKGVPFLGEHIAVLKDWIMEVPNVAAKRAITLGAAMGVTAMSLRVILGIERSYLGGD